MYFRVVREWMCHLGRAAYHAGGMQIIVKGKQASRAEAPILVIAPHSTFLDANIAYVAGLPSIIVRKESSLNPFVGSMFYFIILLYFTLSLLFSTFLLILFFSIVSSLPIFVITISPVILFIFDLFCLPVAFVMTCLQ